MTVIASGEWPESGVTVSQPGGADETATEMGSVLVAAGRVAVSFPAAGNVVLFALVAAIIVPLSLFLNRRTTEA